MESATIVNEHSAETLPELGELRTYWDDVRALGGVAGLLGWDERTMLPPSGAMWRARQLGLVATMLHDRATSDELNRLISNVEDVDPVNTEARVLRREFGLATKLPSSFVRKFTEATTLSQRAWETARANDSFSEFQPYLERVLKLAQERAELLGYETERYDALHDIYEEGSRAVELESLFAELREPLHAMIDRQPEPDTSVLRRHYPIEEQASVGEQIITAMGFDMSAGRIDPTTHPFCSTTGAGDVRLTTRFDERWLPGSLFSTIHEAGHGIYEQSFHRLNLPSTICAAPGLGMHESQSRMYENVIGRSLPFWEERFQILQRAFPEALGNVDVATFVQQINVAERSLIRVEADELTYNLHVAVRFELERKLVNGDLAVADLPEAWGDAYERWVGVRPESDHDGCLQDVHWSTGSFGYFPTYTLGNVYAAQFVERMRQDIPRLDDELRSGDALVVRNWFDQHIYQHGSTLTGTQFVQSVTGGPVEAAPLVRYLESKFM